jgi:four helix bundle protein
MSSTIESESKGTRKIESWRDLEVWKGAHGLVLEVYAITKSFPNDERYRLTDQICRAAASVPTNIAEGKGRISLKEYLQFLSIARGSVEEVKYLLLLAKDLGYIPEQTYLKLAGDYDQVARMLNGLMRSLRLRT